jgi:hypothetical protein
MALILSPANVNARGLSNGPATYTVGFDPFNVITADLLGNGRQDIIAANSDVSNGFNASNTISILFSNGNGTFQAAKTVTVGNNPIGLAAGDFGNGKIDIAVANTKDNTVTILLGDGTGNFTTAQTLAVGATPIGIGVGKFNKSSSKVDLVVLNSDYVGTDNCAASSVQIFTGTGTGTFNTTGTTLATGGCPFGGAIGDLGNGSLDIVVSNSLGNNATTNGNVGVIVGNGDGTFKSQVTYTVGTRPNAVAIADFGTGHPDVAVGNDGAKNSGGNGGIYLLLGNGDGTLQTASPIPGLTQGKSLAVADFDGDGKNDIVTQNNFYGGIGFLKGNGNGTFRTAQYFTFPGLSDKSSAVAAANLGNGKIGLALPEALGSTTPGNVVVVLGNGDGTFQNVFPLYPINANINSIATGQFTTSGNLDLALGLTLYTNCPGSCTPSSQAGVLLGNGNATFNPQTAISLQSGANGTGVAAGSFKNNGKQDIVVIQNSQSGTGFRSYLAGNGNGTFAAPATGALSDNPFQAAATEFTTGGDLSLLYGDCSDLVADAGNGNGTFATANPMSAGFYCVPGEIAVGDFNGDGLPDAAVMDADGSGNLQAYVYLNNGSGGFNTPSPYTVSTSAWNGNTIGIVAGHFQETNPSNQLDLAVTDPPNGNVIVLTNKGDGSGTFNTTTSTYSTGGVNPVYLVAGDFGNGHQDLVVANCVNGPSCGNTGNQVSSYSILKGNGDGTFQAAQNVALGDGTDTLAVGDFGNGALDVAIGNSNSQNVTIVPNTGGTHDVLASNTNPSGTGTAVTFTDTVRAGFAGGATPTGTVNFTASGSTPVTPSNGNALNGSGVASGSLTFTAPGSYIVTASYSGDGTYNPKKSNPVTQTVANGLSTTVLTPPPAPNPAYVNQTVTISATVTPASPSPQGVVTFFSNGSQVGTPFVLTGSNGNVASTTASFAAVGSYSLTAQYTGVNYANSTSAVAVNEVIQLAPTTTTLACVTSGCPATTTGTAVSYTATVTNSAAGAPAVTGSVTFSASGPAAVTPATVNLSTGSATGSLTFNTAGTYTVTATYNPDSAHSMSTSNVVDQLVNCSGCAGTTTTVAIASIAPIDAGQAAEPQGLVSLEQTVTFTVTVMATSGTAAPTGTVQLLDNGVPIGTAQNLILGSGTSSTATISVHGFTIGVHNIGAGYNPNGNFNPSTAASTVPIHDRPKPH